MKIAKVVFVQIYRRNNDDSARYIVRAAMHHPTPQERSQR